MGQTPAKQFNQPQPFGSVSPTNNVSQVQPMAQNQGPGYAPFAAYDQTQQQPQTPGQVPQLFGNGGLGINRIDWMNTGNPFRGLLNQ